jgi:hypothetical protein
VLDLLRDGPGSCLTGPARESTADLSRDDVVVPPGFERRPGVEGPDAPVETPARPARRRPSRSAEGRPGRAVTRP